MGVPPEMLRRLLAILNGGSFSSPTISDPTFSGTAGGSLTSSGWTAVTLNGPWSAYGSPYRALSYRKDIFGVVWLSGLIKTNADPGGFDILGTLPVGYRPTADVLSGSMRALWGATERHVALHVWANGDMEFNAAPGAAVDFFAVEFAFHTT